MKNKVYFAAGSGRIKVGTSVEVEKRLVEINAFLFEPIQLIGTIEGSYALERALQSKFSEFQIKGEWFRDCPELRLLIRKILFYGPQEVGLKPTALIGRRKSQRHAAAVADVQRLIERARQVWPRKTASHLAYASGCAERTTKYWLAGRTVPSAVAAFAVAQAINSASRRGGDA